MNFLFFDIDGTLLPHGKRELSHRTLNALTALKDKEDIIPFLCTGRGLSQTQAVIDSCGYENYIVASGMEIYVKSQLIYEATFDQETLENVISACQEHTDFWGVSSRKAIYSLRSKASDHLVQHFAGYGQLSLNVVDELPDDKFSKVWINGKDEKELDLIIDMLDEERVTIYKWGHLSMEVIPKGENKGKAIKIVTDHFDLEDVKTFGFGDGQNDFEMMQIVDKAIVMENGFEELKKYATTIIPPCEDDGVVEFLLEAGFIKEIAPNKFK